MVTTRVTLQIKPKVREEGLHIFNSLEFCIAANVYVILYNPRQLKWTKHQIQHPNIQRISSWAF